MRPSRWGAGKCLCPVADSPHSDRPVYAAWRPCRTDAGASGDLLPCTSFLRWVRRTWTERTDVGPREDRGIPVRIATPDPGTTAKPTTTCGEPPRSRSWSLTNAQQPHRANGLAATTAREARRGTSAAEVGRLEVLPPRCGRGRAAWFHRTTSTGPPTQPCPRGYGLTGPDTARTGPWSRSHVGRATAGA